MKITLQHAYVTLGVSHGASEEDARSAYRKLALKFHPDKNPDVDTTAKFQEISAAYKRICDYYKRQQTAGNQRAGGRGFFHHHHDDEDDEYEGDSDLDEDDFDFDDVDLEDLELSFEEMLMMFEMMFGPTSSHISGKKGKANFSTSKKPVPVAAKKPVGQGAPVSEKNTSASSVKVPLVGKSTRRRGGGGKGRGGLHGYGGDDGMEAAFASCMDPEMMMFEQFMGMSMNDPDLDDMEGDMMEEMMHLFANTAGEDLFGVGGGSSSGKRKKRHGKGHKKRTTEQVEEDEEEVEEVSDWEDGDDQDATTNEPHKQQKSSPPANDNKGNQSDELPAPSTITLDCRVQISSLKLYGTVKFMGPVHYSKGEFIGVELDEPEGKNNGTVKGIAYFKCDPRHGLMVRAQEIVVVLETK